MMYTIKVKPNFKQGSKVVETGERELTVFLRAKPVEGEANAELIKLLAEYWGVAKGRIRIRTGTRGRVKLVEVL